MQSIFLIGPPGVGKTSVGMALARILSWQFFDTDWLIEKQEAKSVSEIFRDNGEAHFRALESQLIASLGNLRESNIVYATGGGLPVYNDNLKKMDKIGYVIGLSAELPTLVKRVKKEGKRPLLAPDGAAAAQHEEVEALIEQRLSKLICQRLEVYGQARYKIDTTHLNPEQVAHEIMRILGLGPDEAGVQ